MGREIARTGFGAEDFRAFSARLHDNLRALKQVMDRPGFGADASTLGAELEFYLVDEAGLPLPRNREVRDRAADPRATLELNRYNLEYNFPVHDFVDRPFSRLAAAMEATRERLDAHARREGGSLLAIGILPTLQERHLGEAMMTDEPRYRALSDVLVAMRGGSFDLNIDGPDPFALSREDITAEGICTSFQVHFGFPMASFVDTWNAMTLVTPLVLALSTNSPLLLGHRLWHETRVPLFKQSTDGRRRDVPWHDLARVDLTNDWLRHSAWELFAQRVYLYPPLIPVCHQEDPLAVLERGGVPQLHELNLHNGTVWHWNRPIYSGEGDGHIRIEMRSLPAGPSAIDMAANAAFHIGLAVGLRDQVESLLPAIPFRFANENFYRAARHGMDARLIWPSPQQNRLWDKPVRALAESLLETAARGLRELGVDDIEVDTLLGVIERRIQTGQSGSVWQLANFERLRTGHCREEALALLVQGYRRLSGDNRPVADWEALA